MPHLCASYLGQIFGHKGLQSREEVVSECSPEDLESLKALLEGISACYD